MNSTRGFRKIRLVVTVALIAGLGGLSRANDAQVWSALLLKQRLSSDWSTTWRAEPRFTDNFKDIGTVFLRASLARRLNDWAMATMDYTHLDVREFDRLEGLSAFREQHWVGAGITAQFDLTPRWSLKSRNNLHLRWIEGRNSPNVRTRHYVEMAWSPENYRHLKGLYVGNEFFLEHANKTTRENRFTPLGARLKLDDNTSLTVFYLIRSNKLRGGWKHAHVLGTYLSYNI